MMQIEIPDDTVVRLASGDTLTPEDKAVLHVACLKVRPHVSLSRIKVIEVLRDWMEEDVLDEVADLLMPVVRDAIARGFERASVEMLNVSDVDMLRQYARDARADRRAA